MNITLLFQQKFYAAIRALAGKGDLARTVQSTGAKICEGGFRGTSCGAHIAGSSVKPLRVVRVLESGQPRSSVGRMVISGRMADVCAELDRLVAHEAALQ